MRLPDPERSRVVLIGTSIYEDEKLPDLPAVARGIEDLKAALTDPVDGLVPENHCDVLEDEGDMRLIGRRLQTCGQPGAGPADGVLRRARAHRGQAARAVPGAAGHRVRKSLSSTPWSTTSCAARSWTALLPRK